MGGRDFAFLHVLPFFFGLELLSFFACVYVPMSGGGELCGGGAGMFSCPACVSSCACCGVRVAAVVYPA